MAALSKCYYNVRSCPTAKEIRLLLILYPKRRRRKSRLHGRDQTVPDGYHSLAWNEMAEGREVQCGGAMERRPCSPEKPIPVPELSPDRDADPAMLKLQEENAMLRSLIQRHTSMQETERHWRAQTQRLLWDAVLSPTSVTPSPAFPKSLLQKAEEKLKATPKSAVPEPTGEAVEEKEAEEALSVPECQPGQEAAADYRSPVRTPEGSQPSLPEVDWDEMERLDDITYDIQVDNAWQRSEQERQRLEEEKRVQRDRQEWHRKFFADKEAVRMDKGTRREPRRQGCVVEFQLCSGWGFIHEPGLYQGVFVSRRDVESHLPMGHPGRDLVNGDLVSYTRHWGLKGWYALNVSKVSDPVPDAGNVHNTGASSSRAPTAPDRAPESPPAYSSRPTSPPSSQSTSQPAPPSRSRSATQPATRFKSPDTTAPSITQLASHKEEAPVVPLEVRTRTVATQTLIAAHDLFVMRSREHRTVPAPGVEDVIEIAKSEDR